MAEPRDIGELVYNLDHDLQERFTQLLKENDFGTERWARLFLDFLEAEPSLKENLAVIDQFFTLIMMRGYRHGKVAGIYNYPCEVKGDYYEHCTEGTYGCRIIHYEGPWTQAELDQAKERGREFLKMFWDVSE